MDVSHGTWHLKYVVSGGKAGFDAKSQSVKILPNLKASYEKDLSFPKFDHSPKSLHNITNNGPVLKETFRSQQ